MPHSRVINFAPIGSISTSARVKEPAQPAKALCIALKERKGKRHLRDILFVLSSRIRAEADGIAEVKDRQSRHNGVQVDDADALAGFVINHNVVQLRIVVRYAERQLARGLHALGYAVIVCVVEEKRHLIRNVFQPSFRIRLRRL